MANLIQIKRSLTTSNPPSLANGELAYTANGDVLFIGSNSAVVPIAGKRTPGTLTANQALVANTSGYLDYVKTANAWISTLYANGSIGTPGQVLVSNGTTIFWGTGTTGANTQVQFNDSGVANATAGFTFDKASNNLFVANTITVSALAATTNVTISGALTTLGGTNTYITSNTTINGTNLNVNANTTLSGETTVVTSNTTLGGTTTIVNSNLVANGTNLSINANTGFTGRVSSNFLPTVNNSYDIGSSNYYWRSGYFGTSVNVGNSTISDANGTITTNNVNIVTDLTVNNIVGTMTNISSNVNITGGHIYANNSQLSIQSANVSGSLYVGNDLYVGGNVISTNVSTLSVEDPWIFLNSNNNFADTIDSGIMTHYYNGANLHSGLFRHAATDEWYLFENWPYEPSTPNIDIANSSFHLSQLNTYLISAGLISNATNVAITANSTLAVGITANTLTLSSPLAGTSGGSGLNTYTNQDILVANSTNGFNKLSLGASGYLLQSNGTALVYDSIDGGTF